MIAQEVLKSQGSQELQSLLRGRILTTDDGFMGLFKHEGKLHTVFGNVVCVQKAVELEIKLPAGVVFVWAG